MMRTTKGSISQDGDSFDKQDINSSVSIHNGFTLIEMMIVVAIIGILAVIAIPSYQKYLIKGKRVDMMHQMQSIAGDIETQKFTLGSYRAIPTNNINGSYPAGSDPIYNLVVAPVPLSSNWVITATPLATKSNKDDGILTLSAQGERCRITSANRRCGLKNEWND